MTPSSPPLAAFPGKSRKGWRVKAPNTFDLEFGFSCMGYEIAAGWGHAMANTGRAGSGHADRDGRRRHLYDDELRHLLVGPDRPQDDRRGLRQWRLRGHQPPAAGQGRAGFNNLLIDCRVKNPCAPPCRLRQACGGDGRG